MLPEHRTGLVGGVSAGVGSADAVPLDSGVEQGNQAVDVGPRVSGAQSGEITDRGKRSGACHRGTQTKAAHHRPGHDGTAEGSTPACEKSSPPDWCALHRVTSDAPNLTRCMFAAMVDRERVTYWVTLYEQAWRTPGMELLEDLFTDDATYRVTPYDDPVSGLEAIAVMWDGERDGPDEIFTMTSDVVAVEDDNAVVRVEVAYGDPVAQEYRDLWVIRFGSDGRCRSFEEWPFWPQHGRSPSTRATG